MSDIKNLTVAYNPNDFYYYNATFSDESKVNTNQVYLDDNTCNTYISGNISGNIDCRISEISNSNDVKSCYNRELCINRQNAMKIKYLQTNHDGADMRNVDTSVDYNRELLKSYNLAIGSLGILAIFYFLYK